MQVYVKLISGEIIIIPLFSGVTYYIKKIKYEMARHLKVISERLVFFNSEKNDNFLKDENILINDEIYYLVVKT